MKIKAKKLEEAKVSTVKDIESSTRSSNITQRESTDAFPEDIENYIGMFDCSIADTLKDAMKLRANGTLALSRRESDIVARGSIDLSNEFLRAALLSDMTLVLSEGPPSSDSAYILREQYNKGIQWRKCKREQQDAARQRKGDIAITVIEQELASMKLPVWDREKENGFHLDLTKPEWLSSAQYQDRKNTTIKEFEDEGS